MDIHVPGPLNAYESAQEFDEAFSKYFDELQEASGWTAQELHEAGPIRARDRIIDLGHNFVELADAQGSQTR